MAVTDTLRVGGSLSGARGPASTQRDRRSASDQTPTFFADGFVGGEWGGLLMRYGMLAGSGYGIRPSTARRCALDSTDQLDCDLVYDSGGQRRFVRSYGQLHFAVAPPGLMAVSVAVRVPVVVELPENDRTRRTELGTEVALTQSLFLRHLRLDLQPQWSRTRGFAFHIAFLLRFRN